MVVVPIYYHLWSPLCIGSHEGNTEQEIMNKNIKKDIVERIQQLHEHTALPTNTLTLASGEVALKLVGGIDSQVNVVVVVSVGLQERQREVGVNRTTKSWVQNWVGGIRAILDRTHTFFHGEGTEDSCKASA